LILGAGLKALNLPKDIVRPEKSNQYFPVLASTSKGSEDVDEDITKIHNTETSKDGNKDIDPDDAEDPGQALENDDNAPDQVASECNKTGI
jgi:hypothetical protein